MSKYVIATDSTADLPDSFYKKNNVYCESLTCILDGVEYDDKNPLDPDLFYSKLREGSLPTTSQINPDQAKAFFKRILEEEDCDILVLGFSSGLSGTVSSYNIAKQELEDEGLNHRIEIIDTLSASLGEGLFVYKAVKNLENGMTLDENLAWLKEHTLNFIHDFTVDDLYHLMRGGRVSKTAAIFGTLASVKPMLHVDNEGHLIAVGKVRGRKKSISALVDTMEEKLGSFKDENDVIYISHSDCAVDAEELARQITERLGYTNFLINRIGPVIGSHTGIGTIALFYLGEKR